MEKNMATAKKRVSIYVRNNEDGPSCYYRICQYLDDLNAEGDYEFIIHNAVTKKDFRRNLDQKNTIIKKVVQVILFVKIVFNRLYAINMDLAQKPDLIVVQREVFPRYLPMILRSRLKKLLSNNTVVWDFDDDILLGKEISKAEWQLLLHNSNTIVATSKYLLNMVSESGSEKIELPTTDGHFRQSDFVQSYYRRKDEYDSTVRLVWVGTAANLPNIISVLPQIEQASISLCEMKHIELVVVCNIDDELLYKSYNNLSVRFIKWSREGAESAISNSHIGLMPLPNTAFSKGKGGFKLIQYMAAGLPVIASAVGMNCEIITPQMGVLVNDEGDWRKVLEEVCSDVCLWERYSIESKKRYDSCYSYERALSIWKGIVD